MAIYQKQWHLIFCQMSSLKSRKEVGCDLKRIWMYVKQSRMTQLQIVAGVLFGCFLLFGFFYPIRLDVNVKSSKIYEASSLNPSDFEVHAKSLFGISRDVGGFQLRSEDGNHTVIVSSGHFEKKVKCQPIEIKSSQVSMNGSLYTGQLPETSKIQVSVEYKDGTKGTLSDIWVSEKPIGNVKSVEKLPVYWSGGSGMLENIPVVPVENVRADYVGTPVAGDRLLWDRCGVYLEYADGTSFRTHEFVLNQDEHLTYQEAKLQVSSLQVPKYLSEILDISVLTPYGTTRLHIEPQNIDTVVAHYQDEKIYEGDSLDADKIQVDMKTGKDSTVAVSDYRFDNPGYLHRNMQIQIPTRYGLAWLSVPVVPVTGIEVDIGTDVQEGDKAVVKKLSLLYEDGTKRLVDLDDVTWLNLPKQWSEKQSVWFLWHGKEYCVDITPVSKEILENRGTYRGDTYKASDEVITQLSLICQRSGNDNLEMDAAELALMLNRYELYGDGDKGSGDDLLDFVWNSGYWGSKESILMVTEKSKPYEKVKAMVKDTLQSGYRVLPLYVDERLNALDFEGITPEKDTSFHVDDSKIVYWFAVDIADTWYGYTKEAYYMIEKEYPKESVLESDTENDTDDVGISILP